MADINSQLPVRLYDGTNSVAILNTGSNDSLAVAIVDGSGNQITSFGGGTQYATNVAYADGNTGTLAVTVRDDALSALTEADGDFSTLRVDSTGALWVNLTDSTFAVTNAGTFVVQENGAALTALQLIDDAVYVDDADWTNDTSKHLLVGGLYQSTPQTVTDGDVAPFNITANGALHTAVQGTVAVTQSGTWDEVGINDSGNSITVDNGGTFAVQVDGAALTALQLIDNTIFVDDAAYTVGTSSVSVIGGVATSDTVDSGDAGALAIDTSRNLKVIAAANSGVDIGDVTINNTAATAIPVYLTGGAVSGTEVIDYATDDVVAAAGTTNHDYTVTGTTFLLKQFQASASGRIKVELKTGPVGTLVSRGVWFNSSSNPNVEFTFAQALEVPVTTTGTVRLTITNLDNATMDIYSTIIGNDV
jgi:hypothetical protein